MAVKKKKIGAAGRFGAGYGKIKEKFSEVEKKQRIKQDCPFCKGRTKREARQDQAEEAEADRLLDACMLTCYFLNFC